MLICNAHALANRLYAQSKNSNRNFFKKKLIVIDYRVVVLRGIQCDTESSCLDDSVVYGLAIIKREQRCYSSLF